MCYKGRPVPTKTLVEGLNEALMFIRSHSNRIALVAHNAKSCDAPILIQAICRVDLFTYFSQHVEGFVDTLPLFKSLYPERTAFSQESLCADLLEMSYTCHNAIDDCRALKHLTEYAVNCKSAQINSFTLSIKSVKLLNEWNEEKREKLKSYASAVSVSAISTYMAGKCAGTGLRLEHLVDVFRRSGRAGLQKILSDKYDGAVRVTKDLNRGSVSTNPSTCCEK